MPRKSEGEAAKRPYDCVEEVLTGKVAQEVWSVNYRKVLPITLQDFALGSLLPAMMYMFRRGHRRGTGRFREAFGRPGAAKKTRSPISAAEIAAKLAEDGGRFAGFEEEVPKAVLADLLLAFCVENNKHVEGRGQSVARVFPTHYFANWIDLPYAVGHLRYVPEMLVAILADQPQGRAVGPTPEGADVPFAVARGIEGNFLLKLLGPGATIVGKASDLTSDRYDESPLDVDQLLTVRMAQACGSAPQRLAGRGGDEESLGSPEIDNQRPIAQAAARRLAQDLQVFTTCYGPSLPRAMLMPMLDDCLSLGLSNILLSTSRMLSQWKQDGRLPPLEAQHPAAVLVDCSGGTDVELRDLAETSFETVLNEFRRTPAILFCLRLLDARASADPKMQKAGLPPHFPDATAWINALGDVHHGRHQYSDRILDRLEESAGELADELQKNDLEPGVVELLHDEATIPDPAMRLAEGLCTLMGDKQQWWKVRKCLDSCLRTSEVDGMCRLRASWPKIGDRQKKVERRSLVLPNSLLDFLVHRHLAPTAAGEARRLPSFDGFLTALRTDYGLYVDRPPPGLGCSNELLDRNRRLLEKRLRDLGVLVGVNDAESMKRLRSRFPTSERLLETGR